MNKNKIRGIIILGVVLVAYLVLALVIPFKHTATYWIGFIFGIIGIVVSAIGVIIAFKNAVSARSKFYGFPIARLVVIYAIIQIIVSFLLMGLGFVCPSWVGIIICVLLLVFAVIGMVATDAVRDEIERQDMVIKKDTSAMRALQSRANMLVNSCEDENVKESVKKLAEDFRFSDPVSSDAITEIEGQMSGLMDEVEKAVVDGDNEGAQTLIKKLSGILQERNRLCKLNK